MGKKGKHKETGFHSGKRLELARKLFGYTQENIIAEEGFPKVDVRTLRRWEKNGINPLRSWEVAQFFGLELSTFYDKQISKQEFIVHIASARTRKQNHFDH